MRRHAAAVLVGLAVACRAPADAPLPLNIAVSHTAQYAGELVTLQSPAFRGLSLVPLGDTVIWFDTLPMPNLWKNLSVMVGDLRAESWISGPEELTVRVPPLRTGTYDLAVTLPEHDGFTVPLYVAGMAFGPRSTTHTYTNTFTVLPFTTGTALLTEEVEWPGFPAGLRAVDIQANRAWTVPELTWTSPNAVRLEVPGPSYRPGHFVFDLSPTPGPQRATVWSAFPFRLVDSLPCNAPAQFYVTAAEVAPGECLTMLNSGAVYRNGVEIVTPQIALTGAGNNSFRIAPNGRWTVLTAPGSLFCCNTYPLALPVFDSTGAVAYTITGFTRVPGLAFSPDGDTLFAVAASDSATGTSWSLIALDAATGTRLATVPFPLDSALIDVLVDPVLPRLYIASARAWRPDIPRAYSWQPYLTIVDRGTLTPVASIAGSPDDIYYTWVSHVGTLAYGGHQVFLFSWCGFDCGGPRYHAFDLALP